MNPLGVTLSQIAAALDEQGVGWALVGGFAVGARTEPRFTRDLDLAVALDNDTQAERLVFALNAMRLVPFAILTNEATGRLSTARLRSTEPGAAGVIVDLLFASSGIEHEIIRDASEVYVLDGLRAPVPRVGHLIALKLLSESERRLQDRIDLQNLFAVADEIEIARAQDGLRLITQRGCSRNKNLIGLLRRWIDRERPDLAAP